MILCVDVLETGTEAELDALIASALGQPLDSHRELVCVSACREDGHDTTGPGVPLLDKDGKAVLNHLHRQTIDYPIIPGQLRVRLTYKPAEKPAETPAPAPP